MSEFLLAIISFFTVVGGSDVIWKENEIAKNVFVIAAKCDKLFSLSIGILSWIQKSNTYSPDLKNTFFEIIEALYFGSERTLFIYSRNQRRFIKFFKKLDLQ